MAASSNSIGPSNYVWQLAQIYKELKKTHIEARNKICLYINEEQERIQVFEQKKEAKKQQFTILNESHFQKILIKEAADLEDHKIQKAAAKALLFLPWEQKLSIESLNEFALYVVEDRFFFSKEKLDVLQVMFENVQSLSRSVSGGNGAFFISSSYPNPIFPEGRAVIKYMSMEDAEQVILADRFFKEVGFTTPKSRCIKSDTPIGEVIAKAIHALPEENQPLCIREEIEKNNIILVMNILNGTNLIAMNKLIFIDLLLNKNFLKQIGEMILFDLFIGNVDRWSERTCNLGNILVDKSSYKINLIDHQFCLNFENIEEIHSRLMELIKGKSTEGIVHNTFKGAIGYFRKDGTHQFDDATAKTMEKYIGIGILNARKKLIATFSHPAVIRRLFPHPYQVEQADVIVKLIDRII